jgi:hypothetical protein
MKVVGKTVLGLAFLFLLLPTVCTALRDYGKRLKNLEAIFP